MQKIKRWTAGTFLSLVSLSCAATAHDHEAKAGGKVEAKASVDADRPSDPSWANDLSRAQIMDLQRALASRALYKGEIDGSPGQRTESALRNFQIQQGFADSRGLDARTRDALNLNWDRQPVSGGQNDTVVVQRAVGHDTSAAAVAPVGIRFNQLTKDQTKTLQSRLRGMGFYKGEVDGVVGDGTRAALEQYFRSQADLAAQGVVSDATISLFSSCPQ
ncbi:MAG TPA: peptidoglycan-binding protein [Polyangiaceae bacterium]|nr:peptidoglycan-binding protein [Polyangiaceae bacterium]